MRGDGVGVGDIGEVHGVGRGEGDTARNHYSKEAGRERDGGVVGGRGRDERDVWTEPWGDGVGVGDSTGHFEKLKRDSYFIDNIDTYGLNLIEDNIMVVIRCNVQNMTVNLTFVYQH